MSEYIVVPRDAVQRYRRTLRINQLARARYETRNSGRSHHDVEHEREMLENMWSSKPFIMWDGEGPQDAGYALFGNSLGNEIRYPFLRTDDCLRLMLDTAAKNPNAIHVAFGFNYDVSMILRELPHRHLRMIHNYAATVWKGYEIEHVPHKWVQVKYGKQRCKIYDIRSFFAGNYHSVLKEFGVGTDDERRQIFEGKGNRPEFMWADIEEINLYMRLELKLGIELMGILRELFHAAGYVPRSWHGPGALARMALKRHKVYDAMAKTPDDVGRAALFGFAAGRFEPFMAGHIQGKIYNADLNSAYPHFATQLPNLNAGEWEHVKKFAPGKFGIYHIRYDAEPDNMRAFPLFRRMQNASVVWPHIVEGWYWTPETELVANDSDAQILEGWVFNEKNPDDRPLAWIADYYRMRKELKDAGNAGQFTFKLIINSVYGQFAQRAGWDRKTNTPPRSHQIEWAGYITSGCRAAVYRAAKACGDKLVSIDTDGIYSSAPIPGIDIGGNLGEWSTDEYADGVFWQSGIYCLADDSGGWRKAKIKSRGIRKGTYTADDLLRCVYSGETLKLSRHLFVTYGLADSIGWDKHNTWIDEAHEYEMGGGKRMHFPRACASFCDAPRHRMAQWSPTYGLLPGDDMWSVRHSLPWLAPDDAHKHMMRELEIFNENHLSEDDVWLLNQIAA